MTYRLRDGIWAGEYPDEKAIGHLMGQSVTTFVDLTTWDERLLYLLPDYRRLLPEGIKHFRFPLWPYWLPPIERLLGIVRAVEDNSPCYFHCRQGLDRTGVVAALLLVSRGIKLGEALSHLRMIRGADSPRQPYHIRYLEKSLTAISGSARDRLMGSASQKS